MGVYKMRWICPGLLLFLTVAKPKDVLSSIDVDVDMAKNCNDSSKDISKTFEAAANFSQKLQFLGGALVVLAAFAEFGKDDESDRQHEIMQEFAQVHDGIAALKEQISYFEANWELPV